MVVNIVFYSHCHFHISTIVTRTGTINLMTQICSIDISTCVSVESSLLLLLLLSFFLLF